MLNVVLERSCRAEFTCDAPDADSVFLVGAFDGREPTSTPMRRARGDQWTTVLPLPAGHYEYRFVVVYRGQMTVRESDRYGTLSHIEVPRPAVEELVPCS